MMKNMRMMLIAMVMIGGTSGMLLLGVTKTIKVPQPAQGEQNVPDVDEEFDIDQDDPISYISFRELMDAKKEENKPYIMARVQLSTGHHTYYDAHGLNDWLFKKIGSQPWKKIEKYKDINNAPLARLDYFIINEPIAGSQERTQEFRHWCSFDDLVEKTAEWANKFYENEPYAGESKESPRAMLDRAYEHYYYPYHAVEEGEVFAPNEFPEPNYTEANKLFEQVANQSEALELAAEAKGMLGEMYEHGLGVAVDYTRAEEYYTQAAEQRYDIVVALEALDALGDMYYEYEDIKDYDRALRYYKQSVALANEYGIPEEGAHAHRMLGDMYYEGHGVTQDCNEAIAHYKEAIKGDRAYSGAVIITQFKLGEIYYKGICISQDLELARSYFRSVLDSNYYFSGADDYTDVDDNPKAGAASYLYEMDKDASSLIFTHGEKAMDDKKYDNAIGYFKMVAAHEKDPRLVAQADFNLGQAYYKLYDSEHSLSYYRRAADQRADIPIAIQALIQLGKIEDDKTGGYISNISLKREAIHYYEQALKLAEDNKMPEEAAYACNRLGYFYDYADEDSGRDYTKAIEYYKKAAAQIKYPSESVQARYRLGTLYYYARNYGEARNYLEGVINDPMLSGVEKAWALSHLGGMYYKGLGGEVDYAKARTYFENIIQSETEYFNKERAQQELDWISADESRVKGKQSEPVSMKKEDDMPALETLSPNEVLQLGRNALEGSNGEQKDSRKAMYYFDFVAHQKKDPALAADAAQLLKKATTRRIEQLRQERERRGFQGNEEQELRTLKQLQKSGK